MPAVFGILCEFTADADVFVHFETCPPSKDSPSKDSVPLFERVVKCELGMISKCWLFDKEERMRKAAAYFARQRLAGAAADEPLGDWIQRHANAAAGETV